LRTAQVSLTKAQPEDLEGIIQLLRSSNRTVEGVRSNLENFFVVRDGGKLIGVAGLEYYGASALMRSVAVSDQHRGEGIGHSLVERCIAKSKELKIQHLYLLTETAEKFMRRFGFMRVDKGLVDSRLQASEEFKGACPDTAVAMLLEL
jgi:amino-acid N-acetyltransferase